MSASCGPVSFEIHVDARVVVPTIKMTGKCRLCLEESSKLSPIFCHTQGRKFFFDLYRKIFICCGLDINEYDEFSSFICSECVKKLNEAYDFRLVCQRANAAYCQSQGHTRKQCSCLNSNAETEIPKVKKVIQFCESTVIDENNVQEVAKDIQDNAKINNVQVNGVSTINADNNQVKGLSAKNADEKNDDATNLSMTNSPDSNSNVGSKKTGDSSSGDSSGRSDDESNDDLPYEKRLEIARNKYKDVLVLNRLNIPPKSPADFAKINVQKRDSNNANISSAAGAARKDGHDANSYNDVNVKNAQVDNNDSCNVNETSQGTVVNENESVNENTEEQIEEIDRAVDVQTNIVREFDHSFDVQEEIIVAFDDNIQITEEIAYEIINNNHEIQAIIFHEQVSEGIEEELINVGDQTDNAKANLLDKSNQDIGEDSSLVVKNADSSIDKPKKYYKNNPQVPNKSNVRVESKDKCVSSRKRSRSKEYHVDDEVSDIPANKQVESKRHKSTKTKRSSTEIREDDHCYVSQGEGVNSGNYIEVQAEVHQIRERSPEYPVPTLKINSSNVKLQKETNKSKSQNVKKINVHDRITADFDQILNLEDDIAIEVAHNIEISPDNAQSVDYSVGIPDDDVQDSSDYTQVPKSNLVIATNDYDKELNKKKRVLNIKEKKNKKSNNFKSKRFVDSDDDDDEEKDDNEKLSLKKNQKALKKEKKKSQHVVTVKKNVKVKVVPKNKSKEKEKNKISFPFKKLKSKKKLITDEESSDIIRSKRSRIRQSSSSNENSEDSEVVITKDKLNNSKRRKSTPKRPSNSRKMKEKQVCQYCDRSFLYRLPLIKHLQLQHGISKEDLDTNKNKIISDNSLTVNQNPCKKCYVILQRIKK